MNKSTTAEYPAYVCASEVDSDGVHNCRLCGRLVIWGLSSKGNRARFDYPADSDDRYTNHWITCSKAPGKARTRQVLGVDEAPGGCVACREAILRGNVLCGEHWRYFRGWMAGLKPDAYTIWRLGDKQDRRALLKHWRDQVLEEVPTA